MAYHCVIDTILKPFCENYSCCSHIFIVYLPTYSGVNAGAVFLASTKLLVASHSLLYLVICFGYCCSGMEDGSIPRPLLFRSPSFD